ncbi:MAG TPA: PsiF family protein [Albitalea sp.]|nr:PsiF family protein [Albitalea sp.]
MNTLLTGLAAVLAAFSMSAQAASHAGAAPMAASGASAPTKQQSKMGSCSAEFKTTGKAGTERQAFMKECLKKETDAKMAQNNKMKTCSADFKKTGKVGAERQGYMKECLSK